MNKILSIAFVVVLLFYMFVLLKTGVAKGWDRIGDSAFNLVTLLFPTDAALKSAQHLMEGGRRDG